jgi:hypothetical protein
MSEIIIPKGFGVAPKASKNLEEDRIQGSLGVSFPVLVMKEKGVWIWRNNQVDTIYAKQADEDGKPIPSPTIEVVIIRARENLSNQYYIPPYKGEKRPPDCFSSDGITPDDRVDPKTRQAAQCGPNNCPQKKMGSAFTIKGKPTTACRNQRKLAIVLLQHLEDGMYEQYGAALYNVTPTSLQNYDKYIKEILPSIGAKRGEYKSFNVVTRMRQDDTPGVTWQKVKFSAFKALTDEQDAIVQRLRNDDRIKAVLNFEPEVRRPLSEEEQEPLTDETEEQSIQPQPSTTPRTAPAPQTPPRAAPQRPPSQVGGFAATPQTVAEAVNQPAPRPPSQRIVQQEPIEELVDELLDTEMSDDDLDRELSGDLKRLLAGEGKN